ncbi:hypothetical protein QR680_007014 [Steinernema hermaphroditum]|uniref:TRAM domain-containing protein n=1 Tax=Steinernema hermaphroditum TaxID=289476 RepID=A0AA39HXB1_9BILA|nr:hypothetical protein QR680_007014 [Steinernema hermaphroditum]
MPLVALPSMLSYLRLFKSLLVMLRAKENYQLQGEKEQRIIGKVNPRIGDYIDMTVSQRDGYNVTDESDIEIGDL